MITYLQTHSGTQRVTSSRHAQYRYRHSTTRLIHRSRCPQGARGRREFSTRRDRAPAVSAQAAGGLSDCRALALGAAGEPAILNHCNRSIIVIGQFLTNYWIVQTEPGSNGAHSHHSADAMVRKEPFRGGGVKFAVPSTTHPHNAPVSTAGRRIR